MRGVPKDRIIQEKESIYTGKSVRLTKKLLKLMVLSLIEIIRVIVTIYGEENIHGF